ncbi:5-(carboxyamino)imidazole ribonucleotide synthase, partial [Paenibacillus dendritiformis]|nr:5-(carboxyamino)imidazole ribonucleotide synthase [Paenibacillus dendritiformis]
MRAPADGRMRPQEKAPVLAPGATVGVLGGGQLGRMLALEGVRLGYRFVALDPAADAPCAAVADLICADYGDEDGLAELAARADVITYEFENVDAAAVERLERAAPVPQGSRLLRLAQHRLREKEALQAAGIPVAPFAAVASAGG